MTPIDLSELIVKFTVLLVIFCVVCFLVRQSTIRKFIWISVIVSGFLMPILMSLLPSTNLQSVTSLVNALERFVVPIFDVSSELLDRPILNPLVHDITETSSDSWLRYVPLFIWASGVTVMISYLILNLLASRELLKKANRIKTDSLLKIRLEEELSEEFDIPILVSSEVRSPISLGIITPSIILPEESFDWAQSKLGAVILHEFAHIRSRDIFVRLLSILCCSFYWFHPLVWVAHVNLKKEQEKIADNYVLNHGYKASNYAGFLMEIIKSIQANKGNTNAVLRMADFSFFSARMRSILDEQEPRLSMSRLQSFVGTLVIFLILISVASVSTSPIAENIIIGEGSPFGIGLSSNSPLHTAVLNQDMNSIETFITGGQSVNSPDNNGEYPIHLALSIRSSQMVEILLAGGADVTQVNKNGEEPLDRALQMEDLQIVELLLYMGADANRPDSAGKRPLHRAVDFRNAELAELLVAGGANLTLTNSSGQTASQYAAELGLTTIANSLSELENSAQ